MTWPQLGDVRDAAEVAFYVTAILAAGGGLIRFFRDQKERRRQRDEELEQRKRELRWRQAEAAKVLILELRSDLLASDAMLMLDSWSREFMVNGQAVTLSVEDWQRALIAGADVASDPASLFVRDRFDAFFLHLAMFEHHVRNGLVGFDDVEFPTAYYIRIMREDKPIYEQYMSRYGLDRARSFLERFEVWRSPATNQDVIR